MDLLERIAIACDADLRCNTAIGRKIANELTYQDILNDGALDLDEELEEDICL